MANDVIKISELPESVDYGNLQTIGTHDDGHGNMSSKKVPLAPLNKASTAVQTVNHTSPDEDGNVNVSGGVATWGNIAGDIENQTDLMELVNSAKAFVITYDGGTETADKTYAEILAAYNTGRTLVLTDGASFFPLRLKEADDFYFSGLGAVETDIYSVFIVTADDEWTREEYEYVFWGTLQSELQDVLRFTPQTLLPAQAAQARQNIGAAAPTPVATSLPAIGGLLPNVFYNLGAISAALNLSTLAAAIAGVYNEYQVQFALEATLTDVPTITLPADVIWGENGAPSSKFEKGYIFQISITNEGGYLLGEWDRFAIPASE